jgi:hypothetical protein
MKAITKPIFGTVIEIHNRVLKQTSAIYFFKVGIPDLGMTKMKCQNKRQNKTNFILSCSVKYAFVENVNRYIRRVLGS